MALLGRGLDRVIIRIVVRFQVMVMVRTWLISRSTNFGHIVESTFVVLPTQLSRLLFFI